MTTVTAAVSGPVSSSAMLSVKTSESALPPMSSSTVVTMVSSAIMSMAVTSPPENLPLPVCSEMGVNLPPNSIQDVEETVTLVSEDIVRGATSVVGTLPRSNHTFKCSGIWPK